MQPTVQPLFVQRSCVQQGKETLPKGVETRVVSMRPIASQRSVPTCVTMLSTRENASGASSSFSFIRLIQNDAEATRGVLKGFVLISLPEMYYILSESLYDTDKTEAINLLNQVRKSRGLGNVDAANVATRELFEQEMMRERMREFPGMGQTFYALKHYNRSFTDFRNIDTYQPSDAIFKLPWPDRENEYGDEKVYKLQN